MHSLVFKTISEAIPHAINAVVGLFKSAPENWSEQFFKDLEAKKTPVTNPIPGRPRKYKQRDNTPITGEEFDLICDRKNNLDIANNLREHGVPKIKQDELVSLLNAELGLNKAKTFYGNIWNGHKERPANKTKSPEQ